jgi:hypothetical protein
MPGEFNSLRINDRARQAGVFAFGTRSSVYFHSQAAGRPVDPDLVVNKGQQLALYLRHVRRAMIPLYIDENQHGRAACADRAKSEPSDRQEYAVSSNGVGSTTHP